MQAWRERARRLIRGLFLAAPALLLAGVSFGQPVAVEAPGAVVVAPPAPPPDLSATLTRLLPWLIVTGILLAFLWGSWLLLRHLAKETQAKTPAGGAPEATTLTGRYFDLPLGVPEGSVRALLSVFIVVFGFVLLAFQNALELRSGEALTGFIGTVITFYFATRSSEQSRKIVEGAQDAVQRATQAAEGASAAANNASAAATDAGVAARSAAGTAVVVAGAGAGAGGATPEQQSRMATLRDAQTKLQALRSLIAVAGTLGVGTGAVAGADRALQRVDGLLTRITPVIGGQANAETVGKLAEEAGAALRDLGDLGPVGNAVADAMATVGRVAQQSAPIASMLGGIFGGGAVAGPAGLVAAVVVGGLQLVKEKEKFDRWKAAMLDTPLDLGLLPQVVDGGLATAALLRAPLLAQRLAPGGTLEPALALAVWEAVGVAPGRPPVPARELAAQVLADLPGPGCDELRRHFTGNPDALSDAIEDFRAAMTGAAALQGLDMQRITVGGAEVSTMALAGAVRAARQDSRVAAELERMVYMVEALGKADPATLAEVSARLGAPDFLRGAEAEAAAKARAAEQASTAPPAEGGSG
ncbi:hypothetical protein DFH01_06455 [Falsiroseomonas bella]|uniref:Uncharacterized protein n=1 Tax=Falsiroseomonas bella TaxID=2184016 RepID=A0A317FIF5_9PROT|nr:hypothetical protein [Falsiroseomonas bella]PWS38884.1 hypothetical protein DFH01_06455 [Falsiroseomonas bella]